jgi:hypothetical protein
VGFEFGAEHFFHVSDAGVVDEGSAEDGEDRDGDGEDLGVCHVFLRSKGSGGFRVPPRSERAAAGIMGGTLKGTPGGYSPGRLERGTNTPQSIV